MTLPTNTPPEILEVLARYRQGSIDQKEARRQIAVFAKSDVDTAIFIRRHLKWLDRDDAVEWI